MQSSFCVPQVLGSPIKDIVISSYFPQWAKMVVPHAKKVGNKIGFLDFTCGAGKNDDGSETAALQVLKTTIESEEISQMLVSVFCGKEPKNLIKFRQSVANLQGIEKLIYEPLFEKGGSFDDLIGQMQKIRLLPSLIVLDAIGIKDFNLDTFSVHIREGNFDCLFHVQYTLLERMMDNPFKARHLEMIFGKKAADRLRTVADRLNAQQKENLIIKTFLEGLKSLKGYHQVLLSYKSGLETNYLLFITRYIPRHRFMKEIMIRNGYHETPVGRNEYETAGKSSVSIQAGLFNNEIDSP